MHPIVTILVNTYNDIAFVFLYCDLFNSFNIITAHTIAASRSATGPAYIIPSIPINNGNITISGSRNMICLVKAKKLPRFGLPIAVKKFELIGCRKLTKVKNKNT